MKWKTMWGILLHSMLLTGIAISGYVFAADSSVLEMDANIVQSPCSLEFSPASPLFLGDVNSADLIPGRVVGIKYLTVTARGCGLGDVDTSPTITLSGTHPTADEAESSDIQYLFRDTSVTNTSSKYFIVVSNKPEPSYKFSDLYKDGDIIMTGKQGEAGEGKDSTIYLGVTCATSDYCEKTRAGSLSAKLTFTFSYK